MWANYLRKHTLLQSTYLKLELKYSAFSLSPKHTINHRVLGKRNAILTMQLAQGIHLCPACGRAHCNSYDVV